jgi:hypothetical protein
MNAFIRPTAGFVLNSFSFLSHQDGYYMEQDCSKFQRASAPHGFVYHNDGDDHSARAVLLNQEEYSICCSTAIK